jgi:hypothetical protein
VTVFLSSSNAREIIACKVEPFELPNHPGTSVYVRQIPIDDLKRLSKISVKDTTEGHKAQIELIEKSIVNEDGTPVFTAELASELKVTSGPIFTDLMMVIGKANNKTKKKAEEDLDDAEKN